MTIPYQKGESGGIGTTRGFLQSLPLGVQPKGGLAVTQLPNLETHAIVNIQRIQVQLDRVDNPFDTFFEERSDFRSDINLSENEIPIMTRAVQTQKASFSPFVCQDSLPFRKGFQIEYN